MNNYVYIIAGLPEITLAFENGTFSYQKTRDYFFEQLSAKDQELVTLLEKGFDDNALTADFYAKTDHCSNRLLRDYFHFDLQMRNRKVHYLAKRLEQNPAPYLMEVADDDFDEEKQLQTLFETEDFVLREQQMDQLKWQKVSELSRSDYFNINVILAFLIKAKIVERWTKLDKNAGEAMFRQLVAEVRGSFTLQK